MSNFSYKDGDGALRTIPVMYGDMTRQVSHIIRDNSEKITLTIDINKIDNTLIDQLKKDLKPFKGDKPLFFNVMDQKKSIRLSLESQKGGLEISTELLTHLDKNYWDYRLN